MKKGVLSHRCTIGKSSYRQHIIFVSTDMSLLSVTPLSIETPHTTFCEGWLIVVAPTFELDKEAFLATLQQQLTCATGDDLETLLSNNAIYSKHTVKIGERCKIYAIQPIDWAKQRPLATSILRLHCVY